MCTGVDLVLRWGPELVPMPDDLGHLALPIGCSVTALIFVPFSLGRIYRHVCIAFICHVLSGCFSAGQSRLLRPCQCISASRRLNRSPLMWLHGSCPRFVLVFSSNLDWLEPLPCFWLPLCPLLVKSALSYSCLGFLFFARFFSCLTPVRRPTCAICDFPRLWLIWFPVPIMILTLWDRSSAPLKVRWLQWHCTEWRRIG
jgi:hypothetical protein